MKYDFDKQIDRKNTKCFKWDYLKQVFGKTDILPMWVADLDFTSPSEVIDVMKKRAEHGVFGYTAEMDSFFEAIINWQQKRFSWKIEKEWIVTTPGVVPAINFAIHAFTNPGDKILVQTPVYFPFFTSIQNNDRITINSQLIIENNRYKMDFADLKLKLADNVKMMILCSPHNPVARVWSKDELRKLTRLCMENKVILISDEIHADLVFSGKKHYPIPTIVDEFEKNLLTIMAPSKTFNIAGLSTAYTIIADEKLRKKFKKSIEKTGIHLGNIFGIEALEAAYNFGEEWLQQLLKYLQDNYHFTLDFCHRKIPEIIPVEMDGTYLMWLDCRKLALSQKKLVQFFLNETKLGLGDGKQFGSGGEGFMRLNFGCPRSTLEKALFRIEAAVKKLR